LKEVIFAEDLTDDPELIDGYITLEICEADVDRFLGNIPTLTISNNPANSILEVQCTLTENGVHTLEIVDILGKSVLVKSWSVSSNDTKDFEFEFPLLMYGNGAYFLVLNTPTARYIARFVVWK
jgi:hypothetical protein